MTKSFLPSLKWKWTDGGYYTVISFRGKREERKDTLLANRCFRFIPDRQEHMLKCNV